MALMVQAFGWCVLYVDAHTCAALYCSACIKDRQVLPVCLDGAPFWRCLFVTAPCLCIAIASRVGMGGMTKHGGVNALRHWAILTEIKRWCAHGLASPGASERVIMALTPLDGAMLRCCRRSLTGFSAAQALHKLLAYVEDFLFVGAWRSSADTGCISATHSWRDA